MSPEFKALHDALTEFILHPRASELIGGDQLFDALWDFAFSLDEPSLDDKWLYGDPWARLSSAARVAAIELIDFSRTPSLFGEETQRDALAGKARALLAALRAELCHTGGTTRIELATAAAKITKKTRGSDTHVGAERLHCLR